MSKPASTWKEALTPWEHPRDVAARCVTIVDLARHRDDRDYHLLIDPPPKSGARRVLLRLHPNTLDDDIPELKQAARASVEAIIEQDRMQR